MSDPLQAELWGLLCSLRNRGGSWSRSLAWFPLSVPLVPLQIRTFVTPSGSGGRELQLFLPSRCQPVLAHPCALPQAADMDGFQADTEEDEEDDDCMIVDVQPGKGGQGNGGQALVLWELNLGSFCPFFHRPFSFSFYRFYSRHSCFFNLFFKDDSLLFMAFSKLLLAFLPSFSLPLPQWHGALVRSQRYLVVFESRNEHEGEILEILEIFLLPLHAEPSQAWQGLGSSPLWCHLKSYKLSEGNNNIREQLCCFSP